MKDRTLLAFWLVAVVALGFVHDPAWLAALLALVLVSMLALHGGVAWKMAGRALAAVVLVNVTVSAAYAIWAWTAGESWTTFVLRLNLRVFLLALLALWLTRNIDLVRAVDRWPSIRFLVVIVLGQVRALRRMLGEHRMALVSRSPTRPSLKVRFASAASQVSVALEKTEGRAEALNQGMRARGFFDDRA